MGKATLRRRRSQEGSTVVKCSPSNLEATFNNVFVFCLVPSRRQHLSEIQKGPPLSRYSQKADNWLTVTVRHMGIKMKFGVKLINDVSEINFSVSI